MLAPSLLFSSWRIFFPAAIFILCVGALGIAYTAQYGFNLAPCELCLWQRGPYAIAGLLAMAALQMRGSPNTAIPVFLCGIAFLAEAGLAFHHVGVEQHWWTAFTACTGDIGTGLTMEDLKAQLMAAKPKACDEITWTIFGLSVTVYNVLIGFLAAIFSFVGAKLIREEALS